MDFKGIINTVKGYLKETKAESVKVVWPGKNYVIAATIIVFIIVLLVIIYVMSLDFSFARFFKLFSKTGIR
jgi:preprotein translocase SecE subunit